MCRISVIVPVKNGAATLEKCLGSIRGQNADSIEIIVLESMSTDNSRQIALSFGAKIVDVPTDTFNHGLTRNLGTQHATGDLLYYTVQDAWLPENDMLKRMSHHFLDSNVQAVAGHQATPWGHLDKNPANWFKRVTEPETSMRYFPENSFNKLSSKEQFQKSGWDNVNAMYRKSALISVRFRETNFSEDWLWANDALRNGMKILYDPSCVVFHYHHMYFSYMFRAKFIMNYYFYKFFNQLPVIPWSPLGMARACYTVIKRKEVPAAKKPYWLFHNIQLNCSYFLSVIIFRAAKFFGGKRFLNKAYKNICKEVPQGKGRLLA